MSFSLSVKKFLRYFFRAVFLAKDFLVVYLQKIMVLDFVVVLLLFWLHWVLVAACRIFVAS